MKDKRPKSGIPGIIPPNCVELIPPPVETGPAEEKNNTTTANSEPNGARQTIKRYNRRMLKK